VVNKYGNAKRRRRENPGAAGAEGGVWGGDAPLPTGGGIWGGAMKILIFFPKMVSFGAI